MQKKFLSFLIRTSKKGGDPIRRGGELRRSCEKRKPVLKKIGFTKKRQRIDRRDTPHHPSEANGT